MKKYKIKCLLFDNNFNRIEQGEILNLIEISTTEKEIFFEIEKNCRTFEFEFDFFFKLVDRKFIEEVIELTEEQK
jgi:hypothetical protein